MSGSVLSSVLTTDLATATSVAATTTDAAATSTTAADTTAATSTAAATSTTDAATVTTSSSVVPSSTSSVETSTSVAPTTTSTTETTPTTTSTTAAATTSTTSAAQTTTSTADPTSTTATSTASQSTIVRTITSTQSDATTTSTSTSTSSSISASGTSSPSNSSKGLSDGAKIAIAVVIPVVVIGALLAAALWWYKRRKANAAAAEERRKEAEDYSYHPNADPTLPGSGGADASYQMTDANANAGYRGWGTTTVGSTGRKASTQLSGPVGVAYSDGTPSHAVSDGRSDNRLVDHHATSGAYSPDGEILAAMGPNPNAPHRGLSNASSTYSAAGRSDGSGDNNIGVAYASGPIANNQYYEPYSAANPYEGGYPGSPPDNYGGAIGVGEMQGSAVPIIRDNPARRNTRIENHAHFPQQSAGISQNF